MDRYKSFKEFETEVADLVKEIFLNHLESGCLSSTQFMKLEELGFLYIANYSWLSVLMLNTNPVFDLAEHLFSNDRVFNLLDAQFKYSYNSSDNQSSIDTLFCEAVNEIWRRCIPPLKQVIENPLWINWERMYPMIKQEYRW